MSQADQLGTPGGVPGPQPPGQGTGPQPYGRQPVEQISYEQAPHEQAAYGQAPYGQAPYGQAPHEQAAYEQAPYEQIPYEQAQYGRPYDQQPYEQQPYGQDRATGPFPGPGTARPPRKPGKAPLVAAAVGGIVLLLVIAGVAISLGSDRGGPGAKNGTASAQSAGGRAGKAAQYLAGVPALRFSGSFTSDGGTVQTRLSVTRAGSAMGTVTINGVEADLILIDGKTFIKAGRAFWRSHGAAGNPGDYADRWSRAPDSALDLDIAGTLAPNAIMQRLRSASSASGAPSRASEPTEDVNGAQAIRVTTANGDCYLSASEPYKLLRVAATGPENYRFDVTEVPGPEVPALFTELRDGVKRLAGARDPSVRFVGGSLRFSNCNNNISGCTLNLTATKVSAGEGEGDVRAVMLGRIRANGRTLGGCAGSEPVGSSNKVELSCTVTSSGWRSWMRSARSTPGTHRYSAEARVVAEAVSRSEVSALVAKLDREQQAA